MKHHSIYLELYLSLVADVADSLSWDSNHTEAYIRRRFADEGISFLTKTLPQLGKRFQRSLDGSTPLNITGFASYGTAPNLFRELFERVLDSGGRVRMEACPRTVGLLRQLLLVFYKLRLDYSSESCAKTIECFIRNDQEIRHVEDVLIGLPDVDGLDDVATHPQGMGRHDVYLARDSGGPDSSGPQCSPNMDENVHGGRTGIHADGRQAQRSQDDYRHCISEYSLARIVRTARDIVTRVTSGIRFEDLIPRHGPGSVATGEKPWEKYNFSILYESLSYFWPYDEYFHASLSHFSDVRLHENVVQARVQSNGTAKVVLVPKDSRGPRLISCEPLAHQWIQQSIARELIKTLETNRLTRGRLNFTDQSINQQYAMYGSLGAKWSTMDMKDASDRVATTLVVVLFEYSQILPWILACRSTATRLPDGRVIPLHKFAPMGSALCFPVEALVFWSLAVAAVVEYSTWPERVPGTIRVYGDDIICHSEDYAVIKEVFERVGLLVNSDKCFTHGPFRESCGVDAYNGVNVTPVYLRRVLSSDGSLALTDIPSWVEYHNELYLRGYWRTAGRIRRLITKVMQIPIVNDWNPRAYLCFRMFESHTPDEQPFQHRWNSLLQRREIFAPCMEPVCVYRKLRPYERLFKCLTAPEQFVVDGRTWDKLPRSNAATSPRSACETRRYPVRHRTTIVCRWQPVMG
jgi:hypothetical protein